MRKRPTTRMFGRQTAVAFGTPAAGVGIALVLGSEHLATATALSLLAVVAAAAVAGRTSGVIAAVVSFLGLNFFFTEPRHTFLVQEASDVVSLFAFLLVALIVGTLLTRAMRERGRAERRVTEAHVLSETTARLMSGEPFERILNDLAAELVDLFALTRCEISTRSGSGLATSDRAQGTTERTLTFPMATPSRTFGSLTATRAATGPPFAMAEVDLLRTLGSQTALAMERVLLDEEVRDTRVEAEASRLRAALFSSVTHDLRTPLSSIKASVSGLLGPGGRYTDEQRDDVLRSVLDETDHLNSIVGNLLDLARIRAGSLTPATQPILVEDVVASVLRRMRRRIEATPITTSIRPDVPPVDADPVLLEQALSNVLENAVRFSPAGSDIKISAARWHDVVELRVADRGPGIPPEDRTAIFEEFFRRDAGSGRGGTGLGLAIARAIVVAHGGRIWAEGAPGGGATIVIELPVASIGAVEHPPPIVPQDVVR